MRDTGNRVRPANVTEVLVQAKELLAAINCFNETFGKQYTAHEYQIPHHDGLLNRGDLGNARWSLEDFIDYWQDPDHTYTPPEQILDQRIDGTIGRREAV